MTEEEWLTADDPGAFLRIIFGTDPDMSLSISVRKQRLFAVACSGSVFVQDERGRNAIAVAERSADGLATEEELQKALEAVGRMPFGPQQDLAFAVIRLGETSHLGTVLENAQRLEMSHLPPDPLRTINLAAHRKIWRTQTNLFRDIFGNPFRPASVHPYWHTGNVASLAQAIYADRAFDRLPILADALEDAGCTNADILNHCRQPGEHVRGCWVVDLLLGKK